MFKTIKEKPATLTIYLFFSAFILILFCMKKLNLNLIFLLCLLFLISNSIFIFKQSIKNKLVLLLYLLLFIFILYTLIFLLSITKEFKIETVFHFIVTVGLTTYYFYYLDYIKIYDRTKLFYLVLFILFILLLNFQVTGKLISTFIKFTIT